MEFIVSILILTAFVGFIAGIKGMFTGKVKFLKIDSRKRSFQLFAVMFIALAIGGALLPEESSETANDKHGTENIAGTESNIGSNVSKSEKNKSNETEQKNVEEKEEGKKETQDQEEQDNQTAASQDQKNTNSSSQNPPATSSPLNGELAVHFVDVGQGQAQVIITPNKRVMVIDGGNNDDEERMVAYLKQLGVKKVDILVGTHPDADHIGGIDAIIDSFEIGKIYMPKVQRDTQTFESVLLAIQKKGLTVTTAKAGLTLDLDDNVKADMVAPIGEDSDANEMSAVMRIQFGTRSFLLTGDAGHSSENKMIQSGVTLKSDVLLVAHHGSNTSTSQAFLNAVKPTFAVIQVGKNSYGHPTDEVLARLHNNGIKIYRNDTDGTIVFTTDGNSISVNKNAWVYSGSNSSKKDSSSSKAGTTGGEKSSQNKGSSSSGGGTKGNSGSSTGKSGSSSGGTGSSGGSSGNTGGSSGGSGNTSSNAVTSIKASATIDKKNPGQNEQVTVTVTVKDQNGSPVNGAKVTLTLHYKSKDTVYEGTTDASGVVALPFKIGRAAKGFTVIGDIYVTYNGKTATSQTSFTPQ